MAEGEKLTHVTADGTVSMVDVSAKPATRREAVAEAILRTTAAVRSQLMDGTLPKGEALATARIAGIQAAKRTWELIPLCHPLPLAKVGVELEAFETDAVRIRCTTVTTGPTGVEMEALTGATIAAVTLYDMIKAVDRGATIELARVLSKSGGASGDWSTP